MLIFAGIEKIYMKKTENKLISRLPTLFNRPSQTSGLTLIQYCPPGSASSRTCAAIWDVHGHVHLACPLWRKRAGVLDPQPFIKKFPSAGDGVDSFERTMEWLDVVCFSARSTLEVMQSCEAEPEWRLSCTPYDATNQTLGLGGLSKAFLPDKALLKEVARQCLAQTIKRLIKEDPDFQNVQMEMIEDDTNTRDVAMVYAPSDLAIRVCLLKKVSRTDVIRSGIVAMDRMSQPDANWQHALLVMPGLAIERPIFMTKNVTICSLEFEMIRAALLDLV